jgi:hypothetical protein
VYAVDDLPVNLLDRPLTGTGTDMLARHEISWVNYRPASSDQSEFRHYVGYRRRRTRHHPSSLGRPLRRTSDVFKRDLQFTSAINPLGMTGYMATFAASSGSPPMRLLAISRRSASSMRTTAASRRRTRKTSARGELRRRGDQPGQARPGLGGHPAHLGP